MGCSACTLVRAVMIVRIDELATVDLLDRDTCIIILCYNYKSSLK